MSESELGNRTTASERLFEEYLTAHGYTEWTHEQPIAGRPTTPDYRLRFDGTDLFFDVKEFDAPLPPTELVWFDGYAPIRAKINTARKQFRYYRDYSCSLVLANPNAAFVLLSEPWAILGSMFGNLGVQFPVGPSAPANPPHRQVYLGGGRMRTPKSRCPQNTTISAILALTHYGIHRQRLHIRLHKQAARLGRRLNEDELLELVGSVPLSQPESILRVTVYENPYARIPLNPGLFRGPFDERWGLAGDRMVKTFMGTEVQAIESELARAKKESPL
jgi:hypothetical protein